MSRAGKAHRHAALSYSTIPCTRPTIADLGPAPMQRGNRDAQNF